MSWWKLAILAAAALIYRYFYGREIDELSFFQTWMIGLCVTAIVLLYQLLKRVDAIKERKEAETEDDFEA
jgi:hydrogenase/urease accessory protein HupE